MNYAHIHDSLQNHFGSIEESCRSMRKLSLYFPVMNGEILDELNEVKHRVDGLIIAFESLEYETVVTEITDFRRV